MGVSNRKPGKDVNKFIFALNDKLSQLNRNESFYIFVDITINVSENKLFAHKSNYLNMIESYAATLFINKSTRIDNRSSTYTFIDYIAINCTKGEVVSLVFLNSLTDHFRIGCVVTGQRYNEKSNLLYRDMKHFVRAGYCINKVVTSK